MDEQTIKFSVPDPKIPNTPEKDFQKYFLNNLDQIMESTLPIKYEYTLDTKIMEENKNLFLSNKFIKDIIFPSIHQIINDHQAYLEIEAIQTSNKNQFNFKQNPYDEKGIIHLSEKSFEYLRSKILLMLLMKFLDESKHEDKFIYVSEYNEQVINLSKYITYYYDKNEYVFYIEILLDLYIVLLSGGDEGGNNVYLEQFNFWFLFLIPFLKLKIKNLSYEYFLTDEVNTTQLNSENSEPNSNNNQNDEFKTKILLIQNKYISFIQHFIFLTKPQNAVFSLTNNNLWIEELFESLPGGRIVIESIQSQVTNLDISPPHLTLARQIFFNHLIFNAYGKFSTFKFEKFLQDLIRFNFKVESFMINIFEFENYEYLSLIKYNQDIIDEVTRNAISLFESLKLIFLQLHSQKLNLITLQVKDFVSYKSYMKDIIIKFKDLVREILSKKIKTIVLFSDVIDNCKVIKKNVLSSVSKESYTKYFGKKFIEENNIEQFYNEISNSLSLSLNVNNEIIPSLPNLLIEYNYALNKAEKHFNTKNMFYLTIFEKELKVLNNKTIDLFYLRNFQVEYITNMKLGYFNSFNDLLILLGKLPLWNLHSLKKITFYLRSNKNFSYRNIGNFFDLQWPKRTLTSIKFLYEKGFLYETFDVFTLYEDFISKKYFSQKKEELISYSLMKKTQSALTNQMTRPLISLNETSIIAANNLIQGNHSMLMELSSMKDRNRNYERKNFSLFPLNFVLFAQIDNYLEFKLNKDVLYKIAMEIPMKKIFSKNLEKKKLKDKFQNAILISEYNNIRLNLIFYCAMIKIDAKNRNKYYLNKLMKKVRKGNCDTEINIFQYIFRFLKGRRVIYNDFPTSFKVFKKFGDDILRSQYAM